MKSLFTFIFSTVALKSASMPYRGCPPCTSALQSRFYTTCKAIRRTAPRHRRPPVGRWENCHRTPASGRLNGRRPLPESIKKTSGHSTPAHTAALPCLHGLHSYPSTEIHNTSIGPSSDVALPPSP